MAKILLIDDDDTIRNLYIARLQAENYEVLSASDGEQGLALATQERPDVIICDAMMPKINGFDMLDILKATTSPQEIHIIMLTALSQAEDKQRAEELGVDKYFVKSQITIEDLVRSVREVLG